MKFLFDRVHKSGLTSLSVIICSVVLTFTASAAKPNIDPQADEELIVKFKADATDAQIEDGLQH
jgi:hypothetical protein